MGEKNQRQNEVEYCKEYNLGFLEAVSKPSKNVMSDRTVFICLEALDHARGPAM